MRQLRKRLVLTTSFTGIALFHEISRLVAEVKWGACQANPQPVRTLVDAMQVVEQARDVGSCS